MHELGIVVHVIDMVEEAARKNGVSKVARVDLEVGEVSTIVPSYFRDCFEWAKLRTEHMRECELNMIIVAGISYCRDCKKTYRTTEYGKACPVCGGHNTYLVTGRGVMVKDIQAM